MDKKFPALRNCGICKHERVAEVERDFLSEKITPREATELLGCTFNGLKTHIEKHLKHDIAGSLSENAPILAKQIFDKGNEIIESCDRTLSLIKSVTKEYENKKKPEWVSAIVKLETLLSNNIANLTKMHGELRESSTIKVEQLNIQVNNMTQELIENMCLACKTKLAPKILKIVKLDEIPSPREIHQEV